tara:strand:+ start:704 stop:1144 length:441 start_codon:yes stop_codon:yes gene_type:complete
MKKIIDQNTTPSDLDEIAFMEEVVTEVEEIKHKVNKTEALLAKQLKPIPSISQRIIKWILNTFGVIYILIERYVEYPDDGNILGMEIDEDIQKMSRKNLCRYMDAVLPEKGFFDLQSTSKIRLGCQLLRESKRQEKINKTLESIDF